MPSNLKFAVVAALLVGSSPAAMALTHVTSHARHEPAVHQYSAPGYGAELPSSQKPDSGDAWIYENNHYLQMMVR